MQQQFDSFINWLIDALIDSLIPGKWLEVLGCGVMQQQILDKNGKDIQVCGCVGVGVGVGVDPRSQSADPR